MGLLAPASSFSVMPHLGQLAVITYMRCTFTISKNSPSQPLYPAPAHLLSGGAALRIGNGIELCVDGEELYLDPKRVRGLSFVSHAHSDHVPRAGSGKVLCTPETAALAGLGNYCSAGMRLGSLELRLLNSGHMPGSSQLLLENRFRLLYTGDLRAEGGVLCPPAQVEHCDVLIIESTFGKPFYEFPPQEEVIASMFDWVEECHASGAEPVVLGYSMGKAQELTKILSSRFRVEVHSTVLRNNRICEALGVELGSYRPLAGRCPEDRVIIAPPSAKRSMKGDYRYAVVSGWALHSGTKRRYGAHAAFPLSDHSDFYSLVSFVERASPQVVYTVHGFSREFAAELRERGFYAESLDRV